MGRTEESELPWTNSLGRLVFIRLQEKGRESAPSTNVQVDHDQNAYGLPSLFLHKTILVHLRQSLKIS